MEQAQESTSLVAKYLSMELGNTHVVLATRLAQLESLKRAAVLVDPTKWESLPPVEAPEDEDPNTAQTVAQNQWVLPQAQAEAVLNLLGALNSVV